MAASVMKNTKRNTAKTSQTKLVAVPKTRLYIAQSWRRVAAQLIDGVIVNIPLYGFFAATKIDDPTNLFLLSWTHLTIILLTWAVYEAVFLKIKARTPGKMAMGLYITNFKTHLAHLTWKQVMIRTVSQSLGLVALVGPQLVALLRDDRRHIYDIWAGTQVMQKHLRPEAPKAHVALASLAIGIVAVIALSRIYLLTQFAEVNSKGITLHTP
jgi:uncharacterized RDD family membrane protein YckC